MIRKLLALLTAVVMLLGLSCAALAEDVPVPEGRRQITFWHSMTGVNLTAVENLCTRFNESQDEIWVTPIYQGAYDDCLTKLKSAFGAGTAPDVFMMFELGANYLSNCGYVIPFQDRFDADPFMDLNDLVDVLQNYYTINGKLQCFPFNPSSLLLYYNKDAFAAAGIEVPKTFAGMKDVADKLKEAGGVKYAIGLNVYGWNFENLLASSGSYYLNNENGRAGLATEVVYPDLDVTREILSTWKDMVDSGAAFNYGAGQGTMDSFYAFIAGDTGMSLFSTAGLQAAKGAAPFEVGTAWLPIVHEGDPVSVIVGGANLWMYKSGDAQREDDAWAFVKFYAEDPENTATYSMQTGYFAVRKSAYELDSYKAYLAGNPDAELAINQLLASPADNVAGGANTGAMPELRQIWETTMESYLAGDLSLDEALDEMRTQSNDALEFYNEVNGLE
ncbi:MAG: ABC transporter substrate-binding protein [Clostridia bacterium]|nr:ABC transporter substrate-binding protein [Clostridia bacterium]